jgi:hypothetical protein
VRGRARQLAFVALAAALAAGCGSRSSGEPKAASSADENKADWSKFEGTHEPIDTKNARVVPESPIEITGVPYVRGVRLAWSTANDVPSFEPGNETLKLPPETRQAVLAVAIADLPDRSDIRVDWYLGDEKVFSDTLQSRDNGDHYFALVKREGRRLAPLPKGQYRADVSDGTTLVKTVHFEVTG